MSEAAPDPKALRVESRQCSLVLRANDEVPAGVLLSWCSRNAVSVEVTAEPDTLPALRCAGSRHGWCSGMRRSVRWRGNCWTRIRWNVGGPEGERADEWAMPNPYKDESLSTAVARLALSRSRGGTSRPTVTARGALLEGAGVGECIHGVVSYTKTLHRPGKSEEPCLRGVHTTG